MFTKYLFIFFLFLLCLRGNSQQFTLNYEDIKVEFKFYKQDTLTIEEITVVNNSKQNVFIPAILSEDLQFYISGKTAFSYFCVTGSKFGMNYLEDVFIDEIKAGAIKKYSIKIPYQLSETDEYFFKIDFLNSLDIKKRMFYKINGNNAIKRNLYVRHCKIASLLYTPSGTNL